MSAPIASSLTSRAVGTARRLTRAEYSLRARLSVRPANSTESVERQPVVLGIGPTNTAGQGWTWAQAIRRLYPDVKVEVFAIQNPGHLNFPCDVPIEPEEWTSLRWQRRRMSSLSANVTHLLLERGHGALGSLFGRWYARELPVWERLGIKVGLIFHGSEIRDPRKHAELERFSPFGPLQAEEDDRRAHRVRHLLEMAQANADTPGFVTTPGLIDYVPEAEWLPVAIDLALWSGGQPALESAVPVVLHIPTNNLLKGTEYVDAVGRRLHDRGVVRYVRPAAVPPADMPHLMREADVVIDGMVLGDGPSVTVCEAMASSRLVIVHLGERVRARLPGQIPVVQANPETLEEALVDIATRPSSYSDLARRGRAYVGEYHSGDFSAARLAPFLGIR